MPIADVFKISGQGTVVTGQIERGTVAVGESLEIVGLVETQITKAKVLKINFKDVQSAKALDLVTVVLQGVDIAMVKRGQVLAAAGSIKPSTQFKATVHMFTTAEGGRKTAVASGYRPLISVRTSDVSGVLTLPKELSAVEPGSTVSVTINLSDSTALEKGPIFSFREGSKLIGTGVVEKLLN